jgi:phosphatidylglycerophosphatase A
MTLSCQRRLASSIVTFFGAGLSRRAPGTVGSLAGLIIWAPLLLSGAHPLLRLLFVALLTLIGLWSIRASLSNFNGEDPQSIVIDEVCGLGLTLSFCTPSLYHLALGFGLFRLFDIWKPWPVRWADRKVKGANGIMLDDLLAGLYAALLLWIFR